MYSRNPITTFLLVIIGIAIILSVTLAATGPATTTQSDSATIIADSKAITVYRVGPDEYGNICYIASATGNSSQWCFHNGQ